MTTEDDGQDILVLKSETPKKPVVKRVKKAVNPPEDAGNKGKMLATEGFPMATHKGILKIQDTDIQCFVLDDGRRVISGRSLTTSLGLMGRGPGVDRFLLAKSLQPYINDELKEALTNPIQFQIEAGIVQPLGYEAAILPELCSAIIEAHQDRTLRKNQQQMVTPARILLRGFARIGIIALVDEATGYQDYRARQALEKILEDFISGELLKWAKTFPDEFYKQMFRLRGWSYKPNSVKRPAVIGTYTNDLVYERLAPGILDELKRKSDLEVLEARLKNKPHYHRWLTDDIGHPKLREHLLVVIGLMRASTDWKTFMRLINRSLPKYIDKLQMEMIDQDGNLIMEGGDTNAPSDSMLDT